MSVTNTIISLQDYNWQQYLKSQNNTVLLESNINNDKMDLEQQEQIVVPNNNWNKMLIIPCVVAIS